MKIKINKEKSIGKVVFIVEGDRREQTLLRHLFSKVLCYTFVEVKHNQSPIERYTNPLDSHSRIYVITSLSSNIKSIVDGQEYLDNVYTELWERFGFDTTNCALYYIFDRDPQSNNKVELIEGLIDQLKNSRDNGINKNGLLLLSYPSIEAFVIGCFESNTFDLKYKKALTDLPSSDLPDDIKEYIGTHYYKQEEIDDSAIIATTNEMIKNMFLLCDQEFKSEFLDSFENYNKTLLHKEDEYYHNNPKLFRLLSCFACSLIDLGIIELIED